MAGAGMGWNLKKQSWTSTQMFAKKNRVVDSCGQLSESLTMYTKTCTPRTLQDREETLHLAMGPMLAMAQCFGLMPVHGVLAAEPSALHFRRKSARYLLSLCVMVLMGSIEVVAIIHMFKSLASGSEGFVSRIGAATSGAVFYGTSCMGLWLFLRLASQWSSLASAWSSMEQATWSWRRSRLALRFNVLTGVILTVALGYLFPEKRNSTVCPGEQQLKGDSYSEGQWHDFLPEYSCRSHPFVFSVFSYRMVIGVIVFIGSNVATFIWNFIDIFVCVLSCALADTYNKLNQRMLSINGKSLRRQEWQELREQYVMLSSLTKLVDNNICGILLLSFTSNFYFICLQLLNGLSNNPNSIIDSIYTFGSFVFLVTRTMTVTLLAARVNDNSKVGLPVLYNCPSDSYCEEARRLEAQITSDVIALTGLRFFYITRSFMLTVTSAVVTYEVILLQFNISLLSNSTAGAPNH